MSKALVHHMHMPCWAHTILVQVMVRIWLGIYDSPMVSSHTG